MTLPKVIYIMGPPGAGKGTQTMLLAPELQYHQFSTGDAFRKITKQDTPLGRRVKEVVDEGLLAPPELAAEVVIDAVHERLKRGEGLIFDGTPRTLVEAKLVDDFFAKEGYGRPLVVYLDTDKQTMIERNSKRLFCLGVTPDFPIIFRSDSKRCEEAGGTIGKRKDDDPSKFETRWNQFMELTWPVLETYRREGILHRVNGKQDIPAVHKEIIQLINTLYQTNYTHAITEV